MAVALLTLLAALFLHSAWRVGATYDEHFYIGSGLSYLEGDGFALNREHPPLLKLLAAAPIWSLWKLGLLDITWPDHAARLISLPAAFFYQLNAASLDLLLFLGRLPFIALTLWMVIALWRKATSVFGPAAGIATILLAGFNPNTLAHGHLATLDGGVTALIVLAVLAFVELLEAPGPRTALKAGVLFGLANLAKSTALLLGPATLALAVLACILTRSTRALGWTLAVWFTGLGIFSLGYGFDARSINSAWGNERFITVAHQLPPTPEQEATFSAIQSRVNQLALADSDEQQREADALVAELAGAPQAQRKTAVEFLLAPRSDPRDDVRLRSLASLTGRSFPDLASWREWFGANRDGDWDATIFTQPLISKLVLGVFGTTHPIPLFTALKGLDYQLYHASFGHVSYYERKPVLAPRDFADGNPFPWYYTHILAIKNPLAFLLLFVAGLLLAPWRGPGWTPLRMAAWIGFPALLFYTFSVSNMLMGVRYVLPVIPFMALIGASVAARFERSTLALASLSALAAIWVHPHELMYYNLPTGGNGLRTGGPPISSIGDDWGQATRAMGRYVQANQAALEQLGGLYYSPLTTGSPIAYGLERVHRVGGPVQGIVAVHVLNYWRDFTQANKRKRYYAWLDEFEPFDVIDESVYLFDTRPNAPGGDPVEALTSGR